MPGRAGDRPPTRPGGAGLRDTEGNLPACTRVREGGADGRPGSTAAPPGSSSRWRWLAFLRAGAFTPGTQGAK